MGIFLNFIKEALRIYDDHIKRMTPFPFRFIFSPEILKNWNLRKWSYYNQIRLKVLVGNLIKLIKLQASRFLDGDSLAGK